MVPSFVLKVTVTPGPPIVGLVAGTSYELGMVVEATFGYSSLTTRLVVKAAPGVQVALVSDVSGGENGKFSNPAEPETVSVELGNGVPSAVVPVKVTCVVPPPPALSVTP